MHILNEEEAWRAIQAGDEAGLRWLFDHVYRRLLFTVARILPDKDSCEDIVQDVFADLWKRRAELQINTSVQAYLNRMSVNRALNHIKTQRRFQFGDESAWMDTADEPAESLATEGASLEEAVKTAIDNLPEKCKLVFSLSRFEAMTNKEIAEYLGISIKTVENQMTKALRKLREALSNRPDLSCVIILALNSALMA